MAVAANDLAFLDRVSGDLVTLRAYILVAAETQPGLGGAFHYQAGSMNRMAAGTGHVIAFMGAGWPVHKITAPVTVCTYRVADFSRRHLVPIKRNQCPGFCLVFHHKLDVFFTRAMAGFTFSPVIDVFAIVFVAVDAGVCTHIFATGFDNSGQGIVLALTLSAVSAPAGRAANSNSRIPVIARITEGRNGLISGD